MRVVGTLPFFSFRGFSTFSIRGYPIKNLQFLSIFDVFGSKKPDKWNKIYFGSKKLDKSNLYRFRTRHRLKTIKNPKTGNKDIWVFKIDDE